MQKLIIFNLEKSGKKTVLIFRGVFRTQSNIYGGFLGNKLMTKSSVIDVLNTPLVLTIKWHTL